MKPKRVVNGKDIKFKLVLVDDENYMDKLPFCPSIYDCQKEKIVYDFDSDTYKIYDK